ncbi:MAG: TadE/TadG family type IV pilus assembly protein, partial [Rhodospirillaceae bacterium]|nr:TadE/TadG family type IV pilus assembly protein [Rhodospirillaceae bacterium]
MSKPAAKGTLQRIADFAKRLRRDTRGIAALEFGYLAPIMMLMFVCTIELGRMIAIDRRFSQATAMVADLVTRETEITATDLTGTVGESNGGIYGIIRHIMAPYDVTNLTMSITPVQANPDDADDIRVYANTANRPPYNGGDNRPRGQAFALPNGLIAPGASAIVVESTYVYEPIFLSYLTQVLGWSNFNWEDRVVLSPRENCVDFDN